MRLFGFEFGEAAAVEPAIVKVPAKAFSKPVGEGYVDDAGKWHATKREADVASATAHMRDRIDKVAWNLRYNLYYDDEERPTAGAILREPDTRRAMAILGEGA